MLYPMTTDASESKIANGTRSLAMLPADRRALQGTWLFLAALSIFFFSSILLYVVYIFLRMPSEAGKSSRLYIPSSLVFSTVVLLAVSILLEMALRGARRNRDGVVKSSTILASVFGLLFTGAQSIGMYQLIARMLESGSLMTSAYSMTFVLVLLHALHVVGGMVGLILCSANACRDKYDHERSFGLHFCTLYWHFLDIVWVFLMLAFFVAGVALK
jgi:cytochrome c oxidase subunit III